MAMENYESRKGDFGDRRSMMANSLELAPSLITLSEPKMVSEMEKRLKRFLLSSKAERENHDLYRIKGLDRSCYR